MTTKAKTLLKVGIPLVIVIQLISITFLLGKISKVDVIGRFFIIPPS